MRRAGMLAVLAAAALAGAAAAEGDLPPQVGEDVDLLESNGLSLARNLLRQGAGMLPFAFVVRQDGTLQRIVPSEKRALPPPEELFAFLTDAFRESAGEGTYRAIAIFADVVIARPGMDESDAVHARIDHRSGYCADAYYPYRRDEDGTLHFSERVATKRRDGIFGDCDP